MRRFNALTFTGALFVNSTAFACETCRPAVEAGIFDEHFWGRLAIALLPFAVVLCVVVPLHFLERER
ncbi:hypothetical protein D7V80_06015 [Corallococcus sp. CA054B]|uniref:Lipoprotein n=1 Tax=Corallococcus coralloides (strain ATCC 25202 / DSM 2259 / NBRC 100086 / M2) TaxID=1144275 RepID=H8MI84_CORCM|nr:MULTISPECIES: hypothetical protein [Corallococcus]AFE06628.1 hypothetical protein COCOR_05872 [Corallococcus coralloides DSM 2259]RKG70278.1 hypothetical protein D7V80_06015 [Corallococcus sp. CA054B]